MTTSATSLSKPTSLTTVARIVSWIAQLTAAVILAQTLFFKFAGAPESVWIFRTLGVEPWGRWAAGLSELLAVVLLLVPQTAVFGALLALGVMAGAIGAHLTRLGIAVQGDGGLLFGLAVAVTVAALVVIAIRRRQLARWLARARTLLPRSRSAVVQSLVVACVGLGLVSAGVANSSAGDPPAGAVLMPSATDGHGHEIAILAGGCFWGMEQLIRELDGVVDTEVGYSGGSTTDATYERHTGHAESVRVVFDPDTLSYEELLRFFFRIHDPTNRNRQGNDVGSSYRSAIFVMNDDQRRAAEKVVAEVDASGFWKRPIVTEITDAGPFIVAEDYHQDYLVKHPDGYTCHYDRGTIRVTGKKQ